MENIIRLIGLVIFLFLLYALFIAEESSSLTTLIMIASGTAIVLSFVSIKDSKTPKK